MLSVTKIFEFEAGHFLPDYDGKCKNLHGHHWVLEIEVAGEIKEDGMIIDYSVLKKVVESIIINQLDHAWLNDILDYPTSENLLLYIVERLQRTAFSVVKLIRARLYETPTSYCEWKA